MSLTNPSLPDSASRYDAVGCIPPDALRRYELSDPDLKANIDYFLGSLATLAEGSEGVEALDLILATRDRRYPAPEIRRYPEGEWVISSLIKQPRFGVRANHSPEYGPILRAISVIQHAKDPTRLYAEQHIFQAPNKQHDIQLIAPIGRPEGASLHTVARGINLGLYVPLGSPQPSA
jgi:hypothetical protein